MVNGLPTPITGNIPHAARPASLENCAAPGAVVQEAVTGSSRLSELLGRTLSHQQVEQLCAAALPLGIDWLTPSWLVNDDEQDLPSEQEAAWRTFYETVDELW